MNFKQLLLLSLWCVSSLFSEVDYNTVVSTIEYKGLHTVSKKELETIEFQNRIGSKLKESAVIEDIQSVYLSGYFNHVSAETIASNNTVILQFNVTENPAIEKVNIYGNTQFKTKHLVENLYHQPGRVLNFKYLESDKEKILDYYQENGFDLFQITDISYVSPNIDISVEEVIVEDIRFKGLQTIKPFVVQREMNLKPGDAFNSTTIRRDREDLLKLGYFSDISFPKLLKGSKENSLIIELEFKEKKANRIDIGLEQEEEQFVGFIKLIKNHTLFHSDVLSGKVQVGNLDTTTLGINSYSATYFQPWFLNRIPVQFQTTVYDDITQELLSTNISDNTDTELATRKGYTAGFGKQIIQDRIQLGVSYKSENVEAVDSSDVDPYTLNALIVELSYRSIEDIFNPRRGSYWSWSYEEGGDEAIIALDGLSYSKTIVNVATFLNLSRKVSFGIHGNYGVFNTNESAVTYETESFVIGGSNTIRGYKDSDYPYSGSRKLLFNSEIRYTPSDSYQFVLFYDRGIASDENNLKFSDMIDGKGVGARIFTPVGPIRFDLAYGDLWYLHFGIGQVF